ncbi:MAG: ribosome-binding factor A [Rhodospirillaceae bacterium]|nr:ribosome-binding factor A [Rhodospirillaceae bacterium]MBN36437.1 ribosome-binding factor A [Rhodospirillaceae bacterium]|tara:strand:+ start:1276 stop:1653 length:378 start_codon:yes stop_codon:yes gene_type:complete
MSKKRNTNTTRSQRQLRVGEEIRHVLSEMFTRGEVHDSALSGKVITVSEVRMSPDLRHATCFVMPLGGEDLEEVLEGLKRAAPYLRGEVGRRVQLRLTPELAFKADPGFDHAERISTLLRDADGR